MDYRTHFLESMSNIVQGGGDFVCFIDFLGVTFCQDCLKIQIFPPDSYLR
jgi:hypothetical protein